MLDVHAPEHPIGGVREFFLHLFTITCGLLIALALENAAEIVHQHHQRNEARESIRRELEENLHTVQQAAPAVEREMQQTQRLLAFVQARSQGSMADPPEGLTGLSFSEQELPDAAWRTAGSSGVLAFMDYKEAQRYASAYQEQELLQKQAQQGLNDFILLNSFFPRGSDPAKLTPEQAKEALPYVRHALADTVGLLAI